MGSLQPKMKQAGGGQATGTANAFNQFMLNGLNSGSFQSGMQTGGMGNAINSLLNGRPGDMVNSNQFLQQFSQMSQGGYNPFANLPQAPQFQGTQFNPLNTNIQGGNTAGQVFGPNGPQMVDNSPGGIQNFLSQFNGGQNGGAGGMPNLPNRIATPSNLGQAQLPGSADYSFNPNSLMDYSNNPQFQALKQSMDRDMQRGIADMRARFGQTGNAFSTGASDAEAQLRAEAMPKMMLAQGQLGREMQGMDLQQQGVNNAMRSNLVNAQTQDIGNRIGSVTSQFGTNANFLSNLFSGNINQRGQDIQNNQFGANMGQNQNQFTAGLAANMWNQGNQYNLGLQGLYGNLLGNDANNALQAAGMNNNAIQTGNQNMFNNNNAMNSFNQNMFGQQSQNALQNQQMGNQWQMNLMNQLGNMGINVQQLAQSGQLGALGQLFGSYNGINQLGTPQAQMYQQPSGLSQALGMAGQIAGIAGGFMNPMGSLMSMGGQSFNPGSIGNIGQMGGYNPGNFAGAGGGLGIGGMPSGGYQGMLGNNPLAGMFGNGGQTMMPQTRTATPMNMGMVGGMPQGGYQGMLGNNMLNFSFPGGQ